MSSTDVKNSVVFPVKKIVKNIISLSSQKSRLVHEVVLLDKNLNTVDRLLPFSQSTIINFGKGCFQIYTCIHSFRHILPCNNYFLNTHLRLCDLPKRYFKNVDM